MKVNISLVVALTIIVFLSCKREENATVPKTSIEKKSGIVLTTDKTVYSKSEKVRLEIKNNTRRVIYYYPCLSYESLELEAKNEKWIKTDFKYPIDGIMRVTQLNPDGAIQFYWDQTINIKNKWPKRKPVQKGLYRFEFNYWQKTDIPNPLRRAGLSQYRKYETTYSNILRIK